MALSVEVSSSFVPNSWEHYKDIPSGRTLMVEQPRRKGREVIVFETDARGLTSIFQRITTPLVAENGILVTLDDLLPIGSMNVGDSYLTAEEFIDVDSPKPHREYPPVIRITKIA